MAEKAKPDEVETAPDPEEDELDDLDDVLDEFDSKPKLPIEPKPDASGPGRPPLSFSKEEDEAEADIAKQLQTGMESLISELGENPEMQKQFEEMMQELIAAGQAPTQDQAAEHIKKAGEKVPQDPDEAVAAKSGSKAAGASGKKEDTFQDTIRKTMERMQQSGDAATAAASTSSDAAGGSSEEQLLMEMMKSLSAGEGGGSEEDFNTMLMSMMTQLTNKEILYEPMKELHDKFPAWMEKNAATTEKADSERYTEQQKLVAEIVGRFERSGYSDSNEEDREYIVERMQKMQAAGSPPPDLVGDMSAAQDALGDLDAGCPTQ